MKRLSRRDVEELSAASVKLAQAAATIRATKTNYVPAVIQLLVEANDTIVGIRDRALAVVKRILEAAEDQLDQEARARSSSSAAVPAGWPGSEEKPQE